MTTLTGGEAIVSGLVAHGVDTVFGLPGAQVYGLFDAFHQAHPVRLDRPVNLASRPMFEAVRHRIFFFLDSMVRVRTIQSVAHPLTLCVILCFHHAFFHSLFASH